MTFLSPAHLRSHRPPVNVLFVQKSTVTIIAWKRFGRISSSALVSAASLLAALSSPLPAPRTCGVSQRRVATAPNRYKNIVRGEC